MPRKMMCEQCEKLPWASRAPERRCICHGFNLDVGSSDHPQKGFLGMDRRDLPGVSFVWDVESVGEPPFWAQQQLGAKAMPWPFPDDCADKILLSHLFEHITPQHTVAVMNELWRIAKWNSQVLIVVPHADSYGFRQDPTHCNMVVEATWAYFDPADQSGLWTVYRPKPWKIARMNSAPTHNLEVILEPRKKADGTAIDITEPPRKPARRRK